MITKTLKLARPVGNHLLVVSGQVRRFSHSDGFSSSSPSPPPSSPFDRRFSPLVDRMLRVDHAGEFGAQWIYEGQLAVIRARNRLQPGASEDSHKLIKHMQETEAAHLQAIEDIMPDRGVRPSALLPIWKVAGFGLGAVSALLGDRAAMACTVSVEEVITEHYNDQLRTLSADEKTKNEEKDLRSLIKKHRDDEEEHKEIGLKHEAEQAPFYGPISQLVKAGVRTAIWITERV